MTEVKSYVERELNAEQKTRLHRLVNLIDGFQSELSLEVLASVDYILASHPGYGEKEILNEIQSWSERKSKLIKEEYVGIAYSHLKSYSNSFA